LVLALNTPFNAEVLDNGRCGLLYEKNVASLVEKIKFAESHPVEMQQFRALAPARIRERFTWEQITDQYEKLFREITNLKN
jgi:glycosyltransferase involved in cell wall biosynthesis